MTKILRLSPKREEQDLVTNELIAWVEREGNAPLRSQVYAGTLLLGQFSSRLCINRKHADLTKGAKLVMAAGAMFFKSSQNMESGTFRQIGAHALSQLSYQQYTLCSIACEEWVEVSQLFGPSAHRVEGMYAMYSVEKIR